MSQTPAMIANVDPESRRLNPATTDKPPRRESIRNSIDKLRESVVFTMILAVSLAVPVAMIVVGAVYLRRCPINYLIPIFLLVGGCVAVFETLLVILLRIKSHRRNPEDRKPDSNPISGLISFFLFSWLISGSLWVYGIHGKFSTANQTAPDYCHPGAYWFAFTVITAAYCLIGAIVLFLIITGIIMLFN